MSAFTYIYMNDILKVNIVTVFVFLKTQGLLHNATFGHNNVPKGSLPPLCLHCCIVPLGKAGSHSAQQCNDSVLSYESILLDTYTK